jgi:hypothetical protein
MARPRVRPVLPAVKQGMWHSDGMRRKRREAGPTPGGGVYSITSWDDETGDADVVEYDEQGGVVRRHEWIIFAGPPAADGVTGEMVTFDAQDRETGRRPLKTRTRPPRASSDSPTGSG